MRLRGGGSDYGERRGGQMRRGHDDRLPALTSLNFDLEALFLELELGEFGTFHEFDDLLDLFEVQRSALVELSRLAVLVPFKRPAFKRTLSRQRNH